MNEEYLKTIIVLSNENMKLEQRINKAIELLKNITCFDDTEQYYIEKILTILRGEIDNE